MPARAKMLGDGTICSKETLGVARGLEPLQVMLPLSGRLVRILCTMIEIPVLARFDRWEQLAPGSVRALQFGCSGHATTLPRSAGVQQVDNASSSETKSEVDARLYAIRLRGHHACWYRTCTPDQERAI
jgi:hypothetical protein